jgi:lipopolysaccharide biosynthesis protein
MLADKESDMPFCLCWANENWTRRWDAAEHEILIAQKYLPDDDINFIKGLIPFFRDPRYVRLNNVPFLIVYRPQHLPDAPKTAKVWRDYCASVGIGDIHLCAALTHGNEDFTKFGFDSGVEFPPHNPKSANINGKIKLYNTFRGYVMQYATIAQSYLDRTYGSGRVLKTVVPSWDNTARTSDRALVMLNGTPENYEYWLSSTIDQVQRSGEGDQLVFINAWNEWAEGCHLEPDRQFGHGFLQATMNAKNGLRRFTAFQDIGLPHADKVPHRMFWKDVGNTVRYHFWLRFGKLKLAVKRRPRLQLILLPVMRSLRALRERL